MNRGERGFTAIEMLIAITLSGIVGAIATTVIVQGFRQQSAADARTAAVAHVRTALQRTVRELREATVTSLIANSLSMTDGARTLRYYLQTSNGITSLMVDDGSTASTVVGNLVNDTSAPVFSAIRGAQTPTPPAGINPYTCAIIGLVPTTYSPADCVGTVTLRLRVMPTDAGGHAECGTSDGCVIDVQDSVDLRNVT